MYYYRARYYDPEVGRFLTEDPLQFNAGVNFYAYVNNNPINANDPSGLDGYYVSRPLGMDPTKKISHNFYVYNAKFLGDPEAVVISFGLKDNGNLGRIKEMNTHNIISKSTHDDDVSFWKSFKVREGNASLITTDDEISNRVVNAVQENNSYGLINSNSATQAIAQQAYWESGYQGPVAPPNSNRSSPGVSNYDKIQFGPSSGDAGGISYSSGPQCGSFWDNLFNSIFSFDDSPMTSAQEQTTMEGIMDSFIPEL